MRNNHVSEKKFKVTVIVILAVFVPGCGATPVVVGPPKSGVSARPFPHGESVFLFPPHLSYERVENETALPPDEYGADETSLLLISTTKRKLIEKGMRILTSESISEDKRAKMVPILKKLENKYRVLASYYKSKKEVMPLLQKLKKISDASIACVQLLRVKVGSGPMWDPVSGQVRPGTSSSDVRIVLISLFTGEHLWANEVFVRSLPSDKPFSNALEMLFEESSDQKGG